MRERARKSVEQGYQDISSLAAEDKAILDERMFAAEVEAILDEKVDGEGRKK